MERYLFFGKLLETIEYEKNIPGDFQNNSTCETAFGVMNIRVCNSCLSCCCSCFWMRGFVTDMRGIHDKEGSSIFTARAMITMGARANGVIPIDTVHIDVTILMVSKKFDIGKTAWI